jgi:microcystin-dependent protein
MSSKSYVPYILAGAVGAIVATVAPLFFSTSRADSTKLLPFQGRLTDASGNAVADGAKVVEFKMYDAPTGGSVKWAGEVHKLSVNGGLVNTMLGSKAGLGSVDFSTATFLQVTVDANGDGQITSADPPLLPRQSIVSAVYASEAGNARNSGKLAGADWSSIMVDGAGQPSNEPIIGSVKGSKVQAGSITGTQLAANSVDSGKIVDGTVGNAELAASAVTSDRIMNGTILPEDLSSGLQTSLVLPGSVIPYAGSSVPLNSGWLLCDGSEEAIATYPALAAVLGTNYGTPALNSAATHFKLPDYRGLFLRGADNVSDFTVLPAAINSTTNTIAIPNHGFARNTFPVRISNTGGALPVPLTVDTTYFVIIVDQGTIRLAVSEANALANTAVDFTTQGTGTHKIVSWMDPDKSFRTVMAAGGTAGKNVGSVQTDDFKSHRHKYYRPVGGAAAAGSGPGVASLADTDPTTPPPGGNETRPKNASVNYLIKY